MHGQCATGGGGHPHRECPVESCGPQPGRQACADGWPGVTATRGVRPAGSRSVIGANVVVIHCVWSLLDSGWFEHSATWVTNGGEPMSVTVGSRSAISTANDFHCGLVFLMSNDSANSSRPGCCSAPAPGRVVDCGGVQPTRTFNVASPRRVLFSASSESSSSNRSTGGTSASSSARISNAASKLNSEFPKRPSAICSPGGGPKPSTKTLGPRPGWCACGMRRAARRFGDRPKLSAHQLL